MVTDDTKALVQRYYHEVANAEPAAASAAVEELLSADFVFYPPNDTAGNPGRDTHKGFLAWHHSVAPDEQWLVEELIAAGNTVVSRFRFAGAQQGEFAGVPASGKHFTFSGVDIFRVADGRVTELRRYFDVLTVLEQIGGLPTAEQATQAANA